MTLKEALKRIEALEEKVAYLQARPAQEIHYHTHNQQPVFQPEFHPWSPYWPQITYGANSARAEAQ